LHVGPPDEYVVDGGGRFLRQVFEHEMQASPHWQPFTQSLAVGGS
jgi:hypothetical protein